MKRKLMLIFLMIVAMFACAFGIAGCSDSGSNGHVHTYSSSWTYDDAYHWHASTCGHSVEVSDKAEHTFEDDVCSVCGYEKGNIPPVVEEYTVTYDANGGEFSGGITTLDQTGIAENSTLTAPVSPTRSGWTFSGWATDRNGSNLWNFASDTVTGNITLYAVWQQQSAAILSVEGATIDGTNIFMLVSPDTNSVSLSDKIVCSTNSVWRLYYDQLGQTEIPTRIAAGINGSLNDGNNVFYIVVTSSDGTQVNTYELMIHRSYVVTVNYYDNKNNLLDSKTAYTGNEFTANYTPNIVGYTFNSWKDGNGKTFVSGMLWQPLSLYADCTANSYTVTFDANGGNALTEMSKLVTYGKVYTFAVPMRTGYSFLGWYYGTMQLTDPKGASLMNWNYAANTTVTAQWQANDYEVTLTLNDDNAGTVTGEGNHKYDSSVTITAKTNNGYTWLGWFNDENECISNDVTYTFIMGFDISYNAKWIKCPVTIEKTIDNAGEVTGLEGATVINKETTISARTNSGYTWIGWYHGQTKLTDEYSYTFILTDVPVTYTAKWINAPTATSSDTSMGTVSDMPETLKIGQEVVLTASVPNLGYVFKGWYNGENLITRDYIYTFIVAEDTPDFIAKYETDTLMENFIFESTANSCTITGLNSRAVAEIIVPDYVTEIDKGAFQDTVNLKSITLPFVGGSKNATAASSSTLFGYIFGTESKQGITPTTQAYRNGYRVEYYIPKSIVEVTITGGNIFYGAFHNCSSLTSITIGNSVTSIGYDAFRYCSSLEKVNISDIDAWCAISFANDLANPLSYAGSLYLNGELVTEMEISDGTKDIGISFQGCTSLKSIVIPGSVETIRQSAFEGCSSLTDVTLEEGIKTISTYAFMRCPIVNISIPNSIERIRNHAFGFGFSSSFNFNEYDNAYYLGNDTNPYLILAKAKTTDIASCLINENVKLILDHAFENCSKLETVTIPKAVTSFAVGTFGGCSLLTEINYKGTLEEWENIEKATNWFNVVVDTTLNCTDQSIII